MRQTEQRATPPRPHRRSGAIALVAGTTAALVAGAGLRPLTRRWPAALLGSALSSLATETPRASATVAATVGLAAWRRGAATTTPGRVGLAATVLAVGVLVDLDRRARAVGHVLDDALRRELGPVAPSTPGRRLPSVGARRRYTAGTQDLAYGPHASQRLDVWRHPDLRGDGRAPVLVQIHGGAWSSGSKATDAHPLMAHMVECGWVCVSIDYRLGPSARWPAMIVDVTRAIAWTRAHIAGYGGDPDVIAVTGGSAGAHLAALAALTPGRWPPDPDDPDGAAAGDGADTSVVAAVCLYGIYDLTTDDGSGTLDELLADTMMATALAEDRASYAAASPAARVHPDAPPFMILHGTADAIVVPTQSAAFAARLRAVSRAPVVHAELDHAQHGFDLVPTARTAATVRAIEAFLAAVVASRPGHAR